MAEFDNTKRFPTAQSFDRKRLFGTTSITANGTSTVIGTENYNRVAAVLIVGTATGTSPTLDVKLQTSYDGGTTWFDIAASAQITTSNDDGSHVITHYPFDSDGGGDVPALAVDGTLTAATYKTWPLGDRVRLKWVIGGSDTPTVPVAAHLILRRV